MIFLFNQTGETLKLQADIVTVHNHETEETSHDEMTIWVITPSGAKIGLLETSDSEIIRAAKTRFKLGVMDVHPGRLVGHDFYISKKLTGYDMTKHGPHTMVGMIPCATNPSNDRDVIRNLCLGIFRVEEGKQINLRTYDTNDTSLTKIDTVSVTYENGDTVVYEFRFVAIKWTRWGRLKRPSLVLLKNGDLTEVYKMDSIKSKLRPDVLNDWLTKLTPEESKQLLAEAKSTKEPSKINHVQEPGKPLKYRSTYGNGDKKFSQNYKKPRKPGYHYPNNNGSRPYNQDRKPRNYSSNDRPNGGYHKDKNASKKPYDKKYR